MIPRPKKGASGEDFRFGAMSGNDLTIFREPGSRAVVQPLIEFQDMAQLRRRKALLSLIPDHEILVLNFNNIHVRQIA